MAGVTGPLLSFGASGQIAKTQVYSKWKGRAYVRRYITPANPKSTDQMLTRNVFSYLNNVWRTATADFRAPWLQYVKGKVMIDRNAFIQKNIPVLREATDLDGMVFSPGAAGGISVSPSITFGNDIITVDMVAPSPLPSGWTIVKAVGACIPSADPHSATVFEVTTGTDATSTYSVVLTGLTAGSYAAGGWFVFQRSALATDLAYGASLAELGTVT